MKAGDAEHLANLYPPRANRTDYATDTQHWLDSEGKRQMAILTAEPQPLIWRECERYPDGRFVRADMKRAETEVKR